MNKEFKIGKDCVGVGGGVLILNSKKEILLLKRGPNSKNEAGWWCKPGGAIDFGETAVSAMKREMKEEIGVDIKITGILPNTDQILKKEDQHWLAVNFIGEIRKGIPRIMEPHKHSEIAWFPLDKLPKKTTKTTREPVADYLAKKYIKI